MRFLYITGLMRSGTTIVANFLHSQQNITIYRDYVNTLRNALTKNPTLEYFTDSNEKNLVISNMKNEALKQAKIKMNITEQNINSIHDIYASALKAIAQPSDHIVGNKSTQSILVLEKLLKNPNVLGLYVIRDIRDVLLSTKIRDTQSNKPQVNLVQQAHDWKKELKHIHRLKRMYPDRLLIIKYESFVSQKINNELETFLNVELKWDLKSFKDKMEATFSHNSSYKNIGRAEGLSTKAIGRWKSVKDEDNLKLIKTAEMICSKELVRLGYETTSL